MTEIALRWRVALATLVALAGVTGVVAGALPTIDDVSERRIDRAVAQTDTATESENVTVTFVHDGDEFVIENAKNATVRVRTDAERGRKLTVMIQIDRFIRTAPAVVGKNGTATATFNLSDVESGTEITVKVNPGNAAIVGRVLNESAVVTTASTTTTAGTTTTPDDGPDGHADEFIDVPGFGVPVALAALVGALALARRRKQ